MITAAAKIEFGRICGAHLERFKVRVKQLADSKKLKQRARAAYYALTLGAAQVRLNDLSKWFAAADIGSLHTYYEGTDPLALAREKNPAVDCVASAIWDLGTAGYLRLEQARGSKGETCYRVRRAAKGFIPSAAMWAVAGSTPSAKFNGVTVHAEDDGKLTIPRRQERQDGAPRPTLEVYDKDGSNNR